MTLALRNARALAAGQERWDNAAPEEDDRRSDEVAYLRERFMAAMAGDMSAPAPWSWHVSWLRRMNASAADVLADALEDNRDLLRRAMEALAASAQAGDDGAREVIEIASKQWAERNVE